MINMCIVFRVQIIEFMLRNVDKNHRQLLETIYRTFSCVIYNKLAFFQDCFYVTKEFLVQYDEKRSPES